MLLREIVVGEATGLRIFYSIWNQFGIICLNIGILLFPFVEDPIRPLSRPRLITTQKRGS